MYWYWWAWFAVVAFLIILPLVWGWGYRGWGPPYPRYYTRRRSASGRPATAPPPRTRGGPGTGRAETSGATRAQAERAVLVEEPPPPVSGWGIAADLFWLAVLGATIWAIVAWAY